MKNIDRILWQSLRGELAPEARQQLEEWLQQSEENRQFYFQLQKQWKNRTPEPKLQNQQSQYEKILQAGLQDMAVSKNTGLASFMKIAAGLAIVFLTAFGVWQITKIEPVKEVAEFQWVEKHNQPGQKSRIILPDGSVVWLNAESSLTYPASFSDTSRLIQLRGEAYFQVVKDARRPFVVQTGDFETSVLGTEFNVNAYPENQIIQVSLVEGKVKVNPRNDQDGFILLPGETVACNNNDRSMKKQPFEPYDVAWKDGILYFNKDNFRNVIRKLERWYGVEIQTSGTPPNNWQLNGHFENVYLTEVLEAMQYNRKFSYQLQQKKLLIEF